MLKKLNSKQLPCLTIRSWNISLHLATCQIKKLSVIQLRSPQITCAATQKEYCLKLESLLGFHRAILIGFGLHLPLMVLRCKSAQANETEWQGPAVPRGTTLGGPTQ